jgi:flagellar FliL protein
MIRIGILLLALMLSPALPAEEHGGGHGGKAEGEPTGPVIDYVVFEPSVVVNLQGQRRYLRADVQLLVEGQENINRIKLHMPALRHTLILLFSNRDPDVLAQVEEREKLRAGALEEINKVLEELAGDAGGADGLKDLFFSNFLVQ